MLALGFIGCSPGEEKMNLLFVTFDTTRADALSVYGNDAIQMPAMERLAAEGVVFERAYASVPITLPSHSTMMTGLQPFNHGVRDNGVFVLGSDKLTLAEILSQSGWATGAAVASFPLTRQFGIDQGFDFFDDEVEAPTPSSPEGQRRLFFDERPAGRVNAAVLGWLRSNAGRPFFLWVHYFDPHKPMTPPPPYDELYADPYYGEIAYADENLGFLLDELDRLGITDRTAVVVAGDHGEGRNQHREETHSLLAYDATIHVPLVIKIPGGSAGHRVTTPVGLVDLFPTLLEILGVPLPKEVDGRSLAPVFTIDGPDPEEIPLYAETLSPRINYGWGELRAYRYQGMKFIHGPRPELFDITTDPNEFHDLIDEQASIGTEMRQNLIAFLETSATAGQSEQQDVDMETLAKLEALGYLHGGGDASKIEEKLIDGGVSPQDKVHLISKHSNAKNFLFSHQDRMANVLAQELVDENPENPYYVRLLATTELHLGNFDQAVELLVPLLDPKFSESARSLAMSALATTEINNRRAIRMIGAIETSEAQTPTALGQYLTARCLLQFGQPAEAEKALHRALVIDPKHLSSKIDLGIRLASSQRLIEGIKVLEEATTGNPFNVRAWQALGIARHRSGDPVMAGQALERALELQPDNIEVLQALVVVYIATDRESDARDLLATMNALHDQSVLDFKQRVEERWPNN